MECRRFAPVRGPVKRAMHHDHCDAIGANVVPGTDQFHHGCLPHLGIGGAAPPGIRPPSEMRKAGCNRPLADQTKLSSQIVVDRPGEGKSADSLAARFASLGYSLHELCDGSFLACRWGFSRPLQSMYEARLFCRQIGGAA